jgi:hypothetical protein
MQACPYDALYLNEDLGAVEKCHFCAHRVEKGLQPACVTVCPVGAIIPGDFDDPESRVSLIRRAQLLSVRRPEQGTGPNVMYIGANEVALRPGSAERPRSYIWSQRRNTKPEEWPSGIATEPDSREVLNADAKVEWGWPVGLYLLTKGIAGGAAMIAPFLGASVPWWAPECIALLFTAITVFLLIEDLKKPMHFYKLFTRPNWNSWLVKGGIVLTAFGGISALILLLGYLGGFGGVVQVLRWVNLPVAALVAGYTAFLFKQCKGRDLWEADGLLWHLLAQSVTAGAAAFLLIGVANWVTVGGLVLGTITLLVLHELPRAEKDRTENYHQAAGFLHEMRFAGISVDLPLSRFMFSVSALAFADLVFGRGVAEPAFAVVVLVLLFGYEQAFVRAGQLPPLS